MWDHSLGAEKGKERLVLWPMHNSLISFACLSVEAVMMKNNGESIRTGVSI